MITKILMTIAVVLASVHLPSSNAATQQQGSNAQARALLSDQAAAVDALPA